MTLARQQVLFLAVALALLVAVAAMLVANQLGVQRALDGLSRSQSIIRTVLMMRIVAAELPIDRTERHAKQWRAGMRDLAAIIDSVRRDAALDSILVETIRGNVNDADELFRRFDASAALGAARPAGPLQSTLADERINDALQVALGNVNLAAIRLAELEAAEVLAARQSVFRTSAILVVAMLAILVAYFAVFRRLVLAPIHRLQQASDRIAAGELGYRVGISEKTEIGDLGRHFDHMAGELQASQARMVASNKELEAFAYTVSHDLRAPLRGMHAFSRILIEKYAPALTEDALHCLRMIRDNAMQMGHLIDDLLAFSRLNQVPLAKEPVRQAELVAAALKDLEPEQKGRRIDLSVGELAAAEADPKLLKQVWLNLIGNALKYTRNREAAVIRIGSQTKNGVPVYFVADNGVGFDMRYAQKLFGVFQRLHRAEDYEGTGVGLAIVQRIIDRHGGRIWAQAARNEGATFYFTLQEGEERVEQRS